MNPSNSPSTAPAAVPAREVSHSTLFYQKATAIYDTVRELLERVKSLQTLVEGMCPRLRNGETIAQEHQAAERENLERRLREADIIPAPLPPKRLKMYVFIRKMIIGMPTNNIRGGYVNGEQLKNCSDELKRRMPEGIMHCDLRSQGLDESDYFVTDAAAERAAHIIRERTDWKSQPMSSN